MATQEQKDEQCPELRLAQTLFMLATPDVVGDKAALLAALQADIFEHGASPTFHSLPTPVAPAFGGCGGGALSLLRLVLRRCNLVAFSALALVLARV
jgi:hypothetical protein